MSHKSVKVGTFLVLISCLIAVMFFATISMLQAINPIAALTALTVAIIGIIWFKKTSN